MRVPIDHDPEEGDEQTMSFLRGDGEADESMVQLPCQEEDEQEEEHEGEDDVGNMDEEVVVLAPSSPDVGEGCLVMDEDMFAGSDQEN